MWSHTINMGLVIPHYTSLGIPHIKKTKTKNFLLIFGKS